MRLSCKILLLASFFGFSCSEEEEEEGAEQQFREVAGAFRAVNQFVYHFIDASIRDVNWVSTFADELMTDDDLAVSTRFLSLTGSEGVGELSYEYLTLPDFSARVAAHRAVHGTAADFEEEGPELFVFPEIGEFLSVVKGLDSLDFWANTWFLFARKGEPLDALTSELLPRLDLRSMLFVFFPERRVVEEWYKIGESSRELSKRPLGRYDQEWKFVFTAPDYIWERRSNLGGHNLKAVYVENYPFVYKENGTLTGMTHDLAMSLLPVLNFTIELVPEPDGIYGLLLPNGTWRGMVGMLDRREVDLSIMDFSITDARSKVIDFGTGIYQQGAQLFMHLPKQSASWGTFVDVFNYTFWVLLVIVALLSSVMFHFVFRLSGFQDKNRPWSKSVASVLLSMGSLSVPEYAAKLSTRSSFLTVCLFGAMIYWVYNSVLVALLTVDIVVLSVNSLEELAANTKYQIILQGGNAYFAFFSQATNSINPTAKKIYDASIAGNPNAIVAGPMTANDMLLKDSALIYFGESDGAKAGMGGYPCRIRNAAPRYYDNSVTFAFQKGSPYVPLFNDKILTLKQSGEVQKMIDKYLKAKESISCSASSFTKIGYENIFSAFVLLVSGMALAWVILAAEKTRAACTSRTKQYNKDKPTTPTLIKNSK